jgi:hypothetical protein
VDPGLLHARLMAAPGERLELIDLLSPHRYVISAPAERNAPADPARYWRKAVDVDGAVTPAIDAVDNHEGFQENRHRC